MNTKITISTPVFGKIIKFETNSNLPEVKDYCDFRTDLLRSKLSDLTNGQLQSDDSIFVESVTKTQDGEEWSLGT